MFRYIRMMLCIQVNEKFLRIKKSEYRDGVKRRETRKGWMG